MVVVLNHLGSNKSTLALIKRYAYSCLATSLTFFSRFSRFSLANPQSSLKLRFLPPLQFNSLSTVLMTPTPQPPKHRVYSPKSSSPVKHHASLGM